MRRVLVTVTDDDIACGEPGNACYCPVARAVRRAIPGARVAVWSNRITVNGKPYFADDAVGEWVRRFDAREELGGPACERLAFVMWVEEREFGGAEGRAAA